MILGSPNCFEQVQIVLVGSNWYSTKKIWTVQNHFGPIEGQGISVFGHNFEIFRHSVLFLAEKSRCFFPILFTVKVFIGSPIFLLFVCQLFTKLTSEITKQTVFIKT